MRCSPRFYTRAFTFSYFLKRPQQFDQNSQSCAFCGRYKFCSDNNIRALFETANQELKQINGWLPANKLSLNVQKTKYMLFHKLTDQENIPLKLSSLQLTGNNTERENSLKFLGVLLDKHLTSKKHIQLIENKVSKVAVLY